MFENLFNFSYQRTTKEAFGFYLFYVFLGGVISVLSAIFSIWLSDLGFVFDFNFVDLYLKSTNKFDIYIDRIATIESFFITFFMSFTLSLMFIFKKKLKDKVSICLFVLSFSNISVNAHNSKSTGSY